jgi:hypothetical protein
MSLVNSWTMEGNISHVWLTRRVIYRALLWGDAL